MKRLVLFAAGVAVALLVAGCATRADLLEQEKRFRTLVVQQNRSLEQVKREVERLRGDVEEGRPRSRSTASGAEMSPERRRIVELEDQVHRLESGSEVIGMTLDPSGVSTLPPGSPISPPPVLGEAPPPAPGTPPAPVGAVPPAGEPPQQMAAATPPPTVPPPAPPPEMIDDEWRREVAQDQAVAGTIDVPERAEYLGALQGLSRGECTQAGPQLSGLSTRTKGSPLADNALYWQARCHAAKGDTNRAVTEFYDVVTRYPRSDKAPAALWQQGLLFARMGNAPDARLAFSKLIKDYPASSEAGRARQKLVELEH